MNRDPARLLLIFGYRPGFNDGASGSPGGSGGFGGSGSRPDFNDGGGVRRRSSRPLVGPTQRKYFEGIKLSDLSDLK